MRPTTPGMKVVDRAIINRHLRRRGIQLGALRSDLRAALIEALKENEELRTENEILRQRLAQAQRGGQSRSRGI